MKKLYMILIIANLGFSLQAKKNLPGNGIVNFYNSSNKTMTVALQPAGKKDFDELITLKPQVLVENNGYNVALYDIQCKVYNGKTISDDQIINTKSINTLQAFDSISWYKSSKNNCAKGNCTGKSKDYDYLSQVGTLFSQVFISKLNDSVIVLDLDSDNTLTTALVPLDMFDKGKPSSQEIFNDDNEQNLKNNLKDTDSDDTDSNDTDSDDKPARSDDKPTRKGK